MSRQKELRDIAIVQAIDEAEDLSDQTISIEDAYFEREMMENRREQGFTVPEEWVPSERTEREKAMWWHQRGLTELNQRQTNKPNTEYCGNESEDPMEKQIKEGNLEFFNLYDKVSRTGLAAIVNIGPVRITITKEVVFKKAPESGVVKSSIVMWAELLTEPKLDKKGNIVKPAGISKRIKLVNGCADALIWAAFDKTSIEAPAEQQVVTV